MQAFLIRRPGAERAGIEQELIQAGVLLPLTQRTLWAANSYSRKPLFLVVRDQSGRALWGYAIERIKSRYLPGHTTLRVRDFGGNNPAYVCRAAVAALAKLARTEPRILRLQVNVFSRSERQKTGMMLAECGFREVTPPMSYQHTLSVNLAPGEEELFASFSKSARTRVRECAKKGLITVPVTDRAYSARIQQLQEEAVRRTGGQIASTDWEGVLRMSKEYPGLSRVFGVFVDEDVSPERMRAFGWACNHGDRGEYRAGGSSRDGDSRLPFGYDLVWEMIRWAKATGAEWFDMGGVTVSDGGGALEGISDFKRFFSRDLIEVGAEWVLEPNPFRAKVADSISAARARVTKAYSDRGLRRNLLQFRPQ
ncbi:MAG TPA: hypothetical protein VGJ21_17840 [Terracidiphilus sp.]